MVLGFYRVIFLSWFICSQILMFRPPDVFWRMWRDSYLQELTVRRKWRKDKANLKEGDVVMVKDKNAQRCDWKLARVKVPVTGGDGRVRRVVVTMIGGREKKRDSERAITDLILLPCEQTLSGPRPAGESNVPSIPH